LDLIKDDLQEFSGAWNIRILFVVFGRYEKTAKSLKHDQALIHFLLVKFDLVRKKSIKKQNCMICRFLDIQPQGLSHFCHPIDNEVSYFLVRARDFGCLLSLA